VIDLKYSSGDRRSIPTFPELRKTWKFAAHHIDLKLGLC
jgi:hypothetical protein